MAKNSQFLGKNYNNYNLLTACDPSQVADLVFEDVNETADFVRTETKLYSKVYGSVPNDMQLNVLSSQLKNENPTLWADLQVAGKDLGSWVKNSGNISKTYTNVYVAIPLVDNGNPSSFSTVSLKLMK